VLNYLASRPKLTNFVSQSLVQLFARITKLGWFDVSKDEYVFRNVTDDVGKFLQVNVLTHQLFEHQKVLQDRNIFTHLELYEGLPVLPSIGQNDGRYLNHSSAAI
jgi:hypothetical protein